MFKVKNIKTVITLWVLASLSLIVPWKVWAVWWQEILNKTDHLFAPEKWNYTANGWNDFYSPLGQFRNVEPVGKDKVWKEKGFLDSWDTCNITENWSLTTYWMSSGGHTCEPKAIYVPIMWSPVAVKVIYPWGLGDVKDISLSWWGIAKFNMNSRINWMSWITWVSDSIKQANLAYLPIPNEWWAANGRYNKSSIVALLDETDLQSMNLQNSVNRLDRISSDLNASTPMWEKMTFMDKALKNQIILPRIINWNFVTDETKRANYSFYWIPTNWYESLANPTTATWKLIFNQNRHSNCKYQTTIGWKPTVIWEAGWKWCSNHVKNSEVNLVFRTSRYADNTWSLNQINRWAYQRLNRLAYHNPAKDRNFWMSGVVMNHKARFGIIAEWANMFKKWSTTWDSNDTFTWNQLSMSFRPEMLFHLNLINTSSWGWAYDKHDQSWVWHEWATNSTTKQTYHWEAQTNQQTSLTHSDTKKAADYNWFKSWLIGFSNEVTKQYAIAGSEVWKATQFNQVFLNKDYWLTVPYGSDNRYWYTLDIGFCGDGIIQHTFGEKCDWPGCSIDCQKMEESTCGNGKLDVIDTYKNANWKDVKIYEQCDPWMFKNDNINPKLDSVWAWGKYDGNNNPCYSVAEANIAKKFGLNACNWKVPDWVLNAEEKWDKTTWLKVDVSISALPAWATPLDIRLFKYIVPLQNGIANPKPRIDELNQLSHEERIKFLIGKWVDSQWNSLKLPVVLKDTYNKPLCDVISNLENKTTQICADPKTKWATWHTTKLNTKKFNLGVCERFLGNIWPYYTAPFTATIKQWWPVNFTTWKTTLPSGINSNLIFPNGLKIIEKDTDIKDVNVFKLWVDINTIGKGKTKTVVDKDTELVPVDDSDITKLLTSWACNPNYDTATTRKEAVLYYDKSLNGLNLPPAKFNAIKNTHTALPVYTSTLYNNVALSFWYSVVNIITDLNDPKQAQSNFMQCSMDKVTIKKEAPLQSKVDITNAFKKRDFSSLITGNVINKTYFCAFVMEDKDTTARSLISGGVNQTVKLPDWKTVTTNCVDWTKWLSMITNNQLTFNVTRTKDAAWKVKPWAVYVTHFEPINWWPTVQQSAFLCTADLAGNGQFKTYCNEENWALGDQKPRSNEISWGNVWNYTWFN